MKPLIGLELNIEEPLERAKLVEQLRGSRAPALVLHTCQRLECYALEPLELPEDCVADHWTAAPAFERLVRIAAGLESRILGELEVMGQVRTAYKNFHLDRGTDLTALDRVFQEAIALARKARRVSGIDKNLTSISGLAARELIDISPEGVPLAVIGSGSIAGSAARYLAKRGRSPIRVMSRCPDRAASLALEIGGFGTGLDELAHQLKGVCGILSATAAPHPVVYANHIENAERPLTVIDLGEPADCNPDVKELQGVSYIDLLEIEDRAQVNTNERKACAVVAERIIREGAIEWSRKN